MPRIFRLYCSTQCDLYDDIVGKKYTPTPKDCERALDLMIELRHGFDDESMMLKFLMEQNVMVFSIMVSFVVF